MSKLSKSEFTNVFVDIWLMRDDLPDSMLEQLREIMEEAEEMQQKDDFAGLAAWTNGIMEEEGYQKVFV